MITETKREIKKAVKRGIYDYDPTDREEFNREFDRIYDKINLIKLYIT